ncbi:mechanosensitive ion channel family protein [Vibrio hippocampi]|nr:mechanosensitive ion channel family protein [Vibrio hippocampi]
MLTSQVFAESETSATKVDSTGVSTAVQTNADKIEVKLTQAEKDLKDLSASLQQAQGEQKDAIQLQLFNKNNQLRNIIGTAINNKSLPNQELIKRVDIQQGYAAGAKTYLEETISKVEVEIDKAQDKDKLSLLNDYRELNEYLDSVYAQSWQNLEWLGKLGQTDVEGEEQLSSVLAQRMRLISATIDYFNQQLTTFDTQISAAPESEKTALQMNQLIVRQRRSIETDSLQSLITLGDKMGMETSEYKRQMFDVTGNITQDIFDSKVLLSIVSHWWSGGLDWLVDNAPSHLFQLVVFALILLLTRLVVRGVRRLVEKTVKSKNLNLSHLMQNFFVGMSGNIIWVIGIMVGLSQVGLNLAPILTGFGIAGVIIGFALQDTLSNFAAGMMLLIYRPFDVGDFVFAGGVDGKVSHMSLVNTTIRTFDNQIIIVPNSKIWGDVIKNVTHERIRRVDMVFGIGYGDDLLKAEQVLQDIVQAHPAVLKSPETNIRVHTLNTSSVDFIVRPWVKTDDYWDVYWDITKEVKLRFDREGISIPFPQQDVHLHMVKGAQIES